MFIYSESKNVYSYPSIVTISPVSIVFCFHHKLKGTRQLTSEAERRSCFNICHTS